ncbi:hypothetical protein GGR57DRAFT_65122 [Xylariaceae sp. FL1272]|nr:hypothetical protein GGR57DRAFT_65122 [Xylariaceae sp. FL1272]
MPNVVGLDATVDTYTEREGPNRRILALQQFFFSCPNLKSFSLNMSGGYGGCVIRIPQYEQIRNFRFTGDESFPPLESLRIDGYHFPEVEWKHWQQKMQWSKLRSVNLGPQFSASFLELAAGYAESLRHLKVDMYHYHGRDPRQGCLALENFLRTFTSLESLTVRGCHLSSVSPIANHPRLKRLCLRSVEPASSIHQRPTYSMDYLSELDESLPHLETLELDLHRDGEWPQAFLEVFVDGSKRLRSLTIRLDIGLTDTCTPQIPVRYPLKEPNVTGSSARKVGKWVFKYRWPSDLRVLVLETGEHLRQFPQWEPQYREFEREQSKTTTSTGRRLKGRCRE